ncbi:hypothetical protein AX768_27155 [Burkholderia sp. PAMC 28687]|uniref:hypothetical protein n=1 Tax=Burkholderia sp. PAMC 28687 TaxID=1795874 RepID=UPI0007816E8E|nr:hypothetical protein [Burkholderia sp. PAMC 28687]AMM17832.1 hypothetical protein AX768_27155 [Burkholderia sp. PAMC 28687]
MNLFDIFRNKEFSLRTLHNDLCYLSFDSAPSLRDMASAVFGRDAMNWANSQTEYMDGEPESEALMWAGLLATHKALTILSEAKYAFVPLKPSERIPAWNGPSDVGRLAVARAAQLQLAIDVFHEVTQEIMSKYPDDVKVKTYFLTLAKDVPKQETPGARSKVAAIGKANDNAR